MKPEEKKDEILLRQDEYEKRIQLGGALARCVDSALSIGATHDSMAASLEGTKLILDNVMKYFRNEHSSFELIRRGIALSQQAEELAGATLAKSLGERLAEVCHIQSGHGRLLCAIGECKIIAYAIKKKYGEEYEELERIICSNPSQAKGEEKLIIALSKVLNSISAGTPNFNRIQRQLSFIGYVIGLETPEYPGIEALEEISRAITEEDMKNCHYHYSQRQILDMLLTGFNRIRVKEIRERALTSEKMQEFYSELKAKGGDDLSDDTIVVDPRYEATEERLKFVKGLQKLTLETLILTRDFLNKYDLKFYLGEGTLLGAIRHHGFIPWDDDIDILMPRDDYDRLIELSNQGLVPPELHVDALENNPKHWVLGAKMQLTRKTEYIQDKVQKLSEYCGPYVDIFPLDYWNKPFTRKEYRANRRVKICRRMLFMKTGYSKATKWQLKRIILRFVCLFVSNSMIERTAIKALTKFKDGNRKFMVNLCSYYNFYKEVFPSSFYGDGIQVEFEGELFPVPNEYDYMLKTIYGRGYDTIPPNKAMNMRKHAFKLEDPEEEH